jgi:hypothetical protein
LAIVDRTLAFGLGPDVEGEGDSLSSPAFSEDGVTHYEEKAPKAFPGDGVPDRPISNAHDLDVEIPDGRGAAAEKNLRSPVSGSKEAHAGVADRDGEIASRAWQGLRLVTVQERLADPRGPALSRYLDGLDDLAGRGVGQLDQRRRQRGKKAGRFHRPILGRGLDARKGASPFLEPGRREGPALDRRRTFAIGQACASRLPAPEGGSSCDRYSR